MSALLDRSEKTVVITTEEESAQARDLTEKLRAQTANHSIALALRSAAGQPFEAPVELNAILRKVVEAIAQGGTVTIGTVPKELTTTTAAKMLGISRPTLMQLIGKGELPAHKVGSHTRVLTADVQKYRDARTSVRREGIDELRALEDALGMDD